MSDSGWLPLISKPTREGMSITYLIGDPRGSQRRPASDWAKLYRTAELSPR
jgi:hypothetical protein